MLKILDKATPLFAGFLQSIALTLYIFLVAFFMVGADDLFGSIENGPIIFAPMVVLTLFIFSAMLSASIVLGYPFYLFSFKKNLKRAVSVIASTGVFLVIYFVTYLIIVASFY